MNSSYGKTFNEFNVGVIIKHDIAKTIFESDNNLFSLLTMNHHPVHLNLEYVKNHVHGKILVVGTLVFSLVVGITVGDISGKAIANLEYETVKHLAPVFINDTIRAETYILDKWVTSNKDKGIVYVETKAYNQNGVEVLMLRRKILVPII